MESWNAIDFGYYPYRLECRAGPIVIATLPGLKDRVADVEARPTIDNDWLFLLPRFNFRKVLEIACSVFRKHTA
ncbi:MAG: hypothetical protein K2X72_06230 [Reyranella sp.]|nr:hypothetical protein [Reyranella sp.]